MHILIAVWLFVGGVYATYHHARNKPDVAVPFNAYLKKYTMIVTLWPFFLGRDIVIGILDNIKDFLTKWEAK